MALDLKNTDLLALKATQRRRDAEGDAMVETAETPAPDKKAAVDNSAFFKPGKEPTDAVKTRRSSRLAELLKKRDAEKVEFEDAWNKAK